MAQINKPNLHFNTKLYTGNASTQAITGVGFQPDLVWLKNRSTSNSHVWTDAVRGASSTIYSNSSDAQNSSASNVGSFDSDGFTLGSNAGTNGSGNNLVSWNWKAGNSSGSSNSDGSITSTVSANTTAGFSIVSYTGTGSNATVGHGLGVAPSMVIVKNRSSAENWRVYHKGTDASAPQDYDLKLNLTNARDNDNTVWNDTAPTSSVFSVGTSVTINNSGDNFIAYCFAEKTGFSKFGSYKGSDGVFIYTGFKPAYILGKNAGGTYDWWIFDNKRDPLNDGANNLLLRANGNDAEATFTYAKVDFLSNGFKIYGTDNTVNGNGATMIYLAFAENPIVGTNNIPATAR